MSRRRRGIFCLTRFFVKIFTPDRARISAIAKDMRTIGVHGMTVGLAGGLLANDNITVSDALVMFVCGLIVWLSGVVLTSNATKSDD